MSKNLSGAGTGARAFARGWIRDPSTAEPFILWGEREYAPSGDQPDRKFKRGFAHRTANLLIGEPRGDTSEGDKSLVPAPNIMLAKGRFIQTG